MFNTWEEAADHVGHTVRFLGVRWFIVRLTITLEAEVSLALVINSEGYDARWIYVDGWDIPPAAGTTREAA